MTLATAGIVLQAADLPPITKGMVVVFAVALAAFALFAIEPVRVDVTALVLMVALMVLGPWMGVTPAEGVSGFSNGATVVVLAMFVLSAGVRRTGAVQRLSGWLLSVVTVLGLALIRGV